MERKKHGSFVTNIICENDLCDRDGCDDASFRQVVADLTERYGKKIAPHFQPIRENEKLVGYINIIKNAGRRYTGIGQREECEIPDYCMPNLEI